MAPVRESNGANVGNYFLWEMLQSKRERIGKLYTRNSHIQGWSLKRSCFSGSQPSFLRANLTFKLGMASVGSCLDLFQEVSIAN